MNSAHGRKENQKFQVEGTTYDIELNLRTLDKASPLCMALYHSSLYLTEYSRQSCTVSVLLYSYNIQSTENGDYIHILKKLFIRYYMKQ